MNIELRKWKETDSDALAEYANDWEVAKNLRDVFPFPYTNADAREYIRSAMHSDPEQAILYAIAVEGRAVGSIGMFRGTDVYQKSAELGYWLGRSCWGQGVMTQCVQEICREAFHRWDIVRIYAEPFAENRGSRRVLEKSGFLLEGIKRKSVYKAGEYLDSCLYARIAE